MINPISLLIEHLSFSRFWHAWALGPVGAKRRAVSLVATGALVLIALSAPARADIVWNFTYSGGPFPDTFGPFNGDPNQYDTINGQLTTSGLNAANNTYTIVGISGIDNGSQITGLDPAGSVTDNLLYATAPYLDFGGFSFTTAAGNDINLYFNSSNGHYWDWYDHGTTIVDNGTFAVSQATAAAPEPTSIALLGAGLLVFALLGRKRSSIRPRDL